MVKINNFFKSIIALIAIVVMCLFFSQIKTFAVSTDNNKVTIKYEFVTKSELSKDEISHLKKGIPDIRAQKDAEYLMVYEDASTNSNLHSASKTRTGDSSYLPIYLIITVGSVFFGFLIYRKKHKSVEIKGNIALILMAGLLFAVPFAATQQVNAYTNKNLSKYNKIEKLNIGEKLFQNIPTIENNQSGSFIGVINKADLKGNIPTNPGATQPDVPVQPDVKPDVPVQPDVKPDVPVQPDVKPDVPVQPDVKPDVPVQPDVKPDVPVQPDVKPDVPVQPDVKPDVPVQPDVKPDVPVQPDNSHYKLSTTSEMEELDKNTKYEDGTYYGQYEGRRYTNPIQVIVTVDDGKITDVKKRQDKQIDDGSIYESIGFNGMIDILKKNQNPRNIRKQLNDLFAISKLIYDEGKSNGGSQEAYINATKKYLNNPDLSGIREGIQKDELLNIVKQNLLKKGYNKVDVVSGATYTGRGTVNAVVDALSKAKKDITINDFFIEGNFPHEYYTGDKLNLSGLKVRLEKKNGEKEIIPYNKFKENKLKIVERFSKEEISDNMTLDESVVGEEGLYLEILHTPTGSFKPLHVITVKKKKELLPASGIVIRKKGDSDKDWQKIGRFENEGLKITISDELKSNLLNKEVEFGLVTTLNNKEKIIPLVSSNPTQDMKFVDKEKIFYVKVSFDELKKINQSYLLEASNINIKVNEKKDQNPDNNPESISLKFHSIVMKEKGSNVNDEDKIVLEDSAGEVFTVNEEDINKAKSLIGKDIVFDVVYTDDDSNNHTFTLSMDKSKEGIFISKDKKGKYNGEDVRILGSISSSSNSKKFKFDRTNWNFKLLKLGSKVEDIDDKENPEGFAKDFVPQKKMVVVPEEEDITASHIRQSITNLPADAVIMKIIEKENPISPILPNVHVIISFSDDSVIKVDALIARKKIF